MKTTKPFDISKHEVMRAFKLVKANAGAAGVDDKSIADFEANLKDNLYKLWNRMSSGSYFPPPVKGVSIPKKSGGERLLGVPTVADRVAQMIAKLALEPEIEPHFLADSYGYRPFKSALDAINITRKRCWEYDWILEFDIKGLFDNIAHEMMMKAIKHHTSCKWIILYVERWLKAPMQTSDGELKERNKGTPQGGVISPLLANLFLHYAFDVWMTRNHSGKPWCRYADDGLVHCETEKEAVQLRTELEQRFRACCLELHPTKTKIVYCKDGARKGRYSNTSFDFLGYTFRRRIGKNRKRNSLFSTFTPAVSQSAVNSMRQAIRASGIRNRTDLSMADIANWYNPILRGWYNYYGAYCRSGMYPISRQFNATLKAWAMRKYNSLKGHKTRAGCWLEKIAEENSHIFHHWKIGMTGAFA